MFLFQTSLLYLILQLSFGVLTKKKKKMQIPSIGFDTLIGSGFEIDELEDDLGRRKFLSQFHFLS
jgi:hypothetical protein